MRHLPIIDAADQQFTAILGRRRATIRLRYAPFNNRWSMDLSIDDSPVLTGRKMVTGIDLLAPFNFGVGVLFLHSTKPGAVPGRRELPDGIVRFYHATEADIAIALEG